MQNPREPLHPPFHHPFHLNTEDNPEDSSWPNASPAQKPNTIPSIRDLKLSGRAVFLRLDLNVPLSEPNSEGERSITEDNRIRQSLPTIQFALEQQARLILASHLGRPDGKAQPEFSLSPVASHLAALLDRDVLLTDDCVGDGIELMVQSLKPGQVLLLENLRFHKGEEKNDPTFVRSLAKLAEIYVTDAFGTAHRKHASTYGLPAVTPEKGVGFLIEKELKYLDPLLNAPNRPFHLILGGAKVSDKIKTIESLLRNVDTVCVGGAMAFAFQAALGNALPTGARVPSPEDIQHSKVILREAQRREIPVILPEDFIEAFDIGPKTISKFTQVLSEAKTVFWNGPLGWFEKPEYAQGTFEIAKQLADSSATRVVGGGDTVAAIEQCGLASKFDHLSTGGGAVLEYLEGQGLPGIDVLKVAHNYRRSGQA